ncbi:MAG: 16S rRNA (adenine(1518)-N(6)/adenine(1519)-N(6))-dimethyltransferase RsmA [Anaeroplasmataceae bacterium]|nr:16S rRNA (adenine(1518)-N(6)/adenine(1519)-N(6))-dimethyltransferase RsmA [Anaeroplasmataceae bacterium]
MSKIGTAGFVNKSLKHNQLTAKKKYGQNFLIDQNILGRIVDVADISKKDAIIEIGPGLGSLTEVLCERAGYVLAYEIDSDLLEPLKENLIGFLNYKIINQDILKANIKQDIEQYLKGYDHVYVVANLPYYITTPIILGLLSQELNIQRYVMMMQLEVADRICGKPQTKDYNALSLMIQYKATANKVLKVPRTVFVPAPNVDSAVVRLDVYDVPPLKAKDDQVLYEVLRNCFIQRRKTLYNNLIVSYDKSFVDQMLKDLHISPSVRAEALDLADFISISDYITQKR